MRETCQLCGINMVSEAQHYRVEISIKHSCSNLTTGYTKVCSHCSDALVKLCDRLAYDNIRGLN